MGAMLNRNQNRPIQHNWRDRAVKSRSTYELAVIVKRQRKQTKTIGKFKNNGRLYACNRLVELRRFYYDVGVYL